VSTLAMVRPGLRSSGTASVQSFQLKDLQRPWSPVVRPVFCCKKTASPVLGKDRTDSLGSLQFFLNDGPGRTMASAGRCFQCGKHPKRCSSVYLGRWLEQSLASVMASNASCTGILSQ